MATTAGTPPEHRGAGAEASGRVALRADDLVWNEVDGQIVVLDTTRSTYLAITGAGVSLWPLLVAGTTRHDLVEHLLAVYAVDRATAEADVAEFLTDAAGLLRP
ncbi:PqqD family protein [Kineococcus gynurae]|uniref:PqqD family protein n=1 Tax=Kineococcus gynurae TaxID=452979 RepID=A0ABV5LWR7_9ACTN